MGLFEQFGGEEFAARFRGVLIAPGDDRYDAARKVNNAMIDRHPGLIAQCADVADVIAAVNSARETGCLVAIRGGGHNGAGFGTCDDGLVIDLGGMKGIRVDPATSTVRVGPGCTLGEIDHATHAFGLAVPAGVVSTTGIGGLTLGGGIGYLSRRWGLTIDNLIEVDLVLADGSFVTANAQEHPDLFWVVRGGGGNFGVVTSFLFQARPVGTVVAGPTLWPLEMAADVVRFYDRFIAEAPEELNGALAFLTVPPAPPFPEELHMQKMIGVVWCYTGDPANADSVFTPVTEIGPPALHGVQPMPFPAIQAAFDGLYPAGDQWYWRADYINELGDEAISSLITQGEKLPTLQSGIHLYPVDRAVQQVSASETAFGIRDARWAAVYFGVSPDPADAGLIRDWSVGTWEAVHPYAAGGAYLNFIMDEGTESVQASYDENYARLREIKGRYDPGNLFRVNQNIPPAV